MVQVKPMLGEIELQLVQQLEIDGNQVLAEHSIPALEGDFLQGLGRRATCIALSGVLTGTDAGKGLKILREKFRSAEPVSFVDDINTATKTDKVIIEKMEVKELAGKPDRFEYAFTLREYTPLPPSATEEPPKPDVPKPPDNKIDKNTGTLRVEVIVEGQTDFDYRHVVVTVDGKETDGTALSRTLTNRTDNIWTEEEFPAGDYTVKASANSQPMAGLVKAALQPGQTVNPSVTLKPTSIFATTFLIHFKFNSAFIEPSMLPVLKEAAKYAKNHADEKLVIVGHSDRSGDPEENQYLSERRARAVFAYLVFGTSENFRAESLAEWNILRQKRPKGEKPSIKDSWDTREYQHMLQDLGFYPGIVDGKSGKQTADSVRAYRCHKGLPDGTSVDDNVWQTLIEDYLEMNNLAKDNLSVSLTQFFPNCPNEILKWLGCGEDDPRDRRDTAFRPGRRVELLFVNTDQLPCKIPQPETFNLPAPGAVNSDWCIGSETDKQRCCLVTPYLEPGKNTPNPCTSSPQGPWCRQPAEPGTITVKGSIQRELPGGTLQPMKGQAFVLSAPDGQFKASEQANGEPVPAKTSTTDGTFSFDNMPLGFYNLEVRTPEISPVLVRLKEQADQDVKGPSVSKALMSDHDSLDVIIVNAPVLREIRLPVAAHLMTSLNLTLRDIRTCPDPINAANKIKQATARTEDEIKTLFEGANRIWRQARVRFDLKDIVIEAYAHPIEDPNVRGSCEVDEDEFKFILSKCAYEGVLNVFFFKDFVGSGEAGMGISVENGTGGGLFGGCAVADQIHSSFPGLVTLNTDVSTHVLAHELGHYLNLAELPNTPANADRVMSSKSILPTGAFANTKEILNSDEVKRSRSSLGATDSCVPLSFTVSGAMQIGGTLSDRFIVVQSAGGSVTVDAQIPDHLLDPSRGTLSMKGGDQGANNRQRKVNPASTGTTEVISTYTPAGDGKQKVVIRRALIHVVTFNLRVDGARQISSGSNIFITEPDLTQAVALIADINPTLFSVPKTLINWSGGNEIPDVLRRSTPRTKTGSTTISATIAGITRSVSIIVLTIKIGSIDGVVKGQTLDVQVTIDPSPLPSGISMVLTLFKTSGDGEARFDAADSTTITITQSTVVKVKGTKASSIVNNIQMVARVEGDTQTLAQESFTVFCDVFLPAILNTGYTDYIQPPTLGLLKPLINGRLSNGDGPDIDLTEPLSEMERVVKSLVSGDSVYLSSWFFEPKTALVNGSYRGSTDWGNLFAKKAEEGVRIRIIINDFDPISKMDTWLQDSDITPLNSIILALPEGIRDRYKYIVSMHPATVGFFKSLLAGQGGRPINIASHHQKFMVARKGNETFAFCGGLDIESRKTPARWRYTQVVNGLTVPGLIGWHDIHVLLEGPITRDLEKEFVGRWNREKSSSTRPPLPGWSGYETLTLPPLSAVDNIPSKKIHRVQMIRTVSSNATFSPYTTERDDIKRTYQKAISCACRYLYLENQYFRDTELADWIVNQGRTQPNLIVIMVVVGTAAADDGDNVITQHGNHLQFETFDRIVKGLGSSRVRLYTMKNRSVHSKFMMVDDMWMTIGSANANVRSFELDSELNVATQAPDLVKSFRLRLWAHNLGLSETSIASWTVSDFLANWDAVAASNAALTGTLSGIEGMVGEGIIPFDYTQNPGSEHSSIPDAIAKLDLAPDGKIFADKIPPGVDSPQVV